MDNKYKILPLKYLVFNDNMVRIGTENTLDDALKVLSKRNGKHGHIILADKEKYYKIYAIRSGRIKLVQKVE